MKSRPEHNSPHSSLRPLQITHVTLSCGCTPPPINSSEEIAPRVGTVVWCFDHNETVTVTKVEISRWTP